MRLAAEKRKTLLLKLNSNYLSYGKGSLIASQTFEEESADNDMKPSWTLYTAWSRKPLRSSQHWNLQSRPLRKSMWKGIIDLMSDSPDLRQLSRYLSNLGVRHNIRWQMRTYPPQSPPSPISIYDLKYSTRGLIYTVGILVVEASVPLLPERAGRKELPD